MIIFTCEVTLRPPRRWFYMRLLPSFRRPFGLSGVTIASGQGACAAPWMWPTGVRCRVWLWGCSLSSCKGCLRTPTWNTLTVLQTCGCIQGPVYRVSIYGLDTQAPAGQAAAAVVRRRLWRAEPLEAVDRHRVKWLHSGLAASGGPRPRRWWCSRRCCRAHVAWVPCMTEHQSR